MASLHFRVLGPVELVVDDREVALARKPRAVLAALLLHAGRSLPATSLIDLVWDDAPPASASNSLQVHLCHLRGALRTAGHPDRIIHTPGGYQIHVDVDEVDLHTFDRHLDAAAEARAVGDHQAAVKALHAALAEWRGQALQDVAVGRLAVLAAAQDERRLLAIGQLVEALLELDRAPEALDVLAIPTAEHPCHERLAQLKMTALHRHARTPEASLVFHELAARLDRELGLRPAAATTALHTWILVQDHALDRVDDRQPTVRRAHEERDHELIGRSAELAELRRLSHANALVTVVAPGGAGKTSLARSLAASLVRQGTRVCWADLASAHDVGSVLTAVSAATDVRLRPQAGPEELADMIAGLQGLVVLDHAEHVREACCTLVTAVRRRCPAVRWLVTSRMPLGVPGELVWGLPGLLTPDPRVPLDAGTVRRYEAVQLFAARAVDVDPSFEVDTSTAADVASICARLEGRPLAIELAAAQLRRRSAGVVSRALEDVVAPPTASGGDWDEGCVRQVVEWCLGALSPCAQRVLPWLSLFVAGFTAGDVQAIRPPDVDEGAVAEALDELVWASLVEPRHYAEVRYRLHQVTREFATALLDASAERGAIVRRHARWVRLSPR